jgi:penicillin-binding protein 1A
MNKPYARPSAIPPALAAPVGLAAVRKKFGFLPALFNTILMTCGGLLVLGSAAEPALRERYPIEQTLRPAIKRPLVLISADGQPLAVRGDCVAGPVTLNELPRHFIDALLATEDRRFYSHIGIDPRGILRAARRNYKAGAIREGGSTITQQLVKISYLTSATTFSRKAEEALLAMRLELRLSKDQILERYLSSVYFGDGCYGMRAAAQRFFGKPVDELNIPESALMVALLRSPSRFIKNPDEARLAAGRVVQAMVLSGRLDKAQAAGLQPARIVAAPQPDEPGADYADWLADTLQKEISDPHSQQPAQVHTTFEPALQRIAEKAIRSVLKREGRDSRVSQAAVVVMRTDGRVVAMAGGADHRGAGQFNRAVQARRQPGSAFKMFVYLAALRAGAQPDMVFADEPVTIDGWEPQNHGGSYRGNVTLTEAFSSSINTVAVKVSEAAGRGNVIATARDLGITTPMAPNPSLPLGTSEVSLLELTSAYAAIAAGAYPVKPWGVAGVGAKPADGGTPPPGAGLWKLAEAESMRELLSAVVNDGTGRTAQLQIPAYGKTGTSQSHRDAWFIGFAGNLVVGVWAGNDDGSPMDGVTGGSIPAQIWRRFMREALDDDAGFQRTLPQIAAFEARSQVPPERPSGLASLEEAAVAADTEPRKHRRSRQARARGSESAEQDAGRETGGMGWLDF